MSNLFVIGIGYRPLDARAKELILQAEVVLASKRLFEVFQRYELFDAVKDKIKVINKIDQTMDFIRASLVTRHSSLPLVLLASGDPLFFGIGRKALDEFGHDNVEILPDLSSMQLAFSRVKEPWDDAFLMSLHGGPDPEKRRRLPYEIKDIPALIERHGKVAILTDRENNPAAIAKTLGPEVRSQEPGVRIYVCERLGYEDERITGGTIDEITEMTFADPNVVIIIRDRKSGVRSQESEVNKAALKDIAPLPSAPAFGLTENEITHSRGLITKDEVRAVSIHKLRLPRQGVFWDIGAGSGSVSVEAARMCPALKVYAIEKNEEQQEYIRKNVASFGLKAIEVISGDALSSLDALPSPDRAFIGGSGGQLTGIISILLKKMSRGIIVLNAVLLDTLNDAMKIMSDSGLDPEVSQVSVSRTKIVNGRQHMTAQNPIFIVKGEKR